MYDFASDPRVGLTETRLGWMFYPRNDQYVGRSLELYGEYARLEYEVFRRAVQPGDTVVDAGANIGVHTVHFSKLAGEQGRVLAFEPQRPIFQILNANLMINGCANVEAMPFCVGAENGQVEFPQAPLDVATNFGGVGRHTRSRWMARVEKRTIDSFDLPRCDFIKVDVEGAELEVVLGAWRTITERRPTLCIEAEALDRATPWFDRIVGMGYVTFEMVPRLYVPGNWKKHQENVFGNTVNANILAFHGAVPDWVGEPRFGLRRVRDLSEFFPQG